jgi:hypothetical protein
LRAVRIVRFHTAEAIRSHKKKRSFWRRCRCVVRLFTTVKSEACVSIRREKSLDPLKTKNARKLPSTSPFERSASFIDQKPPEDRKSMSWTSIASFYALFFRRQMRSKLGSTDRILSFDVRFVKIEDAAEYAH